MFNIGCWARRFSKNQKGFTLVELMVVVVIIGVLVAIAVPIFNNVSNNAKEKACAANERTITGAAAMYHAQEGGFPANVAALIAADEGYLQEQPECPFDPANTYTINGTTGIATCSGTH